MLARLQHRHGLLRVQRDGRDQMHRVDGGVRKDLLQRIHTLRAADEIAGLFQPVRVRVAKGQLPDEGMLLVDGGKRAAETEPHKGHVELFHKISSLRQNGAATTIREPSP